MSLIVSDKVNTYNRKITELIVTYKPQIEILMENYNNPIGSYITEVKELIKEINSKSQDDLFLIKSYLCLLLHFYEYETIDDGKLIGNSSNCLFTIANVKSNNYELPVKLFIKVIDYSTQVIGSIIDLCIYDILSSIIFNKIFKVEKYKDFKDFIPEYKGSCLSYTKRDATGSYWDFNDIRNITERDLTFYNGQTLQSNLNPYYNFPVILVMFEAIDNPLSVSNIFKLFSSQNTEENTNLVISVLANAYDMYIFLETLGSDFGFMHNDLHFSNIILDQTKQKLVIIDFGRCIFSKFIDEEDPEIDNKLLTEYKKLNYDITLNRLYVTDPIITNKVNRLYKRDIFKYHISIKGNDRNRKYFGIIYDLITYSLNMYTRSLFFLHKTDDINIDTVEVYFSSLIKVNYNDLEDLVNQKAKLELTSDSIRQLMDNYFKIKTEFIDGTQDEDTRNYFSILLKGLFYTALLLHYTGKNYTLINVFFKVKAVSLSGFYDYIQSKILSVQDYVRILENDSFLMQFVRPSTRGGLNLDTIYSSQISKSKNKSKPKSKSMSRLYPLFSKANINKVKSNISLEETSKAYQQIYNEKDISDLRIFPKDDERVIRKSSEKKLKVYKT